MTVPDSVGGVVCDVAAVVAIIDDLGNNRKGPGWGLYYRARDTGATLAVPAIVVGKAATLYLDRRGRSLLGACIAPQLYRPPDDPFLASGARGVWWVVEARPGDLRDYSAMVGRCGDPVTAFVAAYAAAMDWPVATDEPRTYERLLGRNDAVVMPAPRSGATDLSGS